MRKVTEQYYSKDGQFQVYNTTALEGDCHKVEVPGLHSHGNVDGDSDLENTKTPWTCILSVDSTFDAVQHFGENSDHLQKIKNNAPRTNWLSGEHKLLMSFPTSATNGLTQDEIDALPAKKSTQFYRLDTQAGTLSHHMNYNIQDQEFRIKNSGWLDKHHYMSNFMKTMRPTAPLERTFLNDSHEVCVTFMPPARPGKAGWNRYDGYVNGVFMTWHNDGEHNIKQNKDLYEEEWIISATNAALTGGGRHGNENEGKIVLRGMPYKLTSPQITFKPNNNMILHIGRLKV